MIFVYGDLIIDEYVYGTSTRLSPEAPVPVVLHHKTERRDGGALNVFRNIQSLTSNVQFMTEYHGQPPLKQRIYANGHYVTRIDHEGGTEWSHNPLPSLNNDDIVVISDYNKGAIDVLSPYAWKGTKSIVDPKNDLNKFAGAWCLKPNKAEFENWLGRPMEGLADVRQARRKLEVGHLIVTMGDRGCAYAGLEDSQMFHVDPVEVADVTGAGDTFIATLAYALESGHSMPESIHMANKAAGIAVTHHGVYIIKPDDLDSKSIVFTNGCFDILHPGHVKLLQECSKLGKVIVGLNSDASIRRLKGPHRPINSQYRRQEMLEALGYQVVVFEEDTPENLISQLKPDIIVKGGDYSPENVVGHDKAKVVIIPLVEDYSTSGIVERIKNAT